MAASEISECGEFRPIADDEDVGLNDGFGFPVDLPRVIRQADVEGSVTDEQGFPTRKSAIWRSISLDISWAVPAWAGAGLMSYAIPSISSQRSFSGQEQ